MTFHVGFIPTGWKRGLPLRILRPSASNPGFVSLDRTRLPRGEKLAINTIGMIRFTAQESAEFEPWLEWWNADG